MRRSLIAPLLLVLCAAGLAAGPTLVYRDDPLFVQARRLALAAGSAPPSLTSPITYSELSLVLDMIDVEALSDELLEVYRDLRQRIAAEPGPEPTGSIKIEATAEAYLHTSDDPGAWRYWYPDRRAFLSIPIRAWPIPGLHIAFDLDWRKNYPFFPGTALVTVDPDPVSNLPLKVLDTDVQFPFQALVSLGGDRWSVQFGRSLVSLGSGVSGSLLLSDHVEYHDFLMASVFGRAFTYRALYLDLEAWRTASTPVDDRMFFAHRIEMRPFPWLSLVANDAFIYAERPIELRYFNPLMLMHNWFVPRFGNSLFSFEMALRPFGGLEMYAHLAIEQLQSAVERERGYADGEPEAMGYLAGLEYTRPLTFGGRAAGWLTIGTEWVYLDPWMYLGRTDLNTFSYRRRVQAEHVIPAGAKVLVEKSLGYPTGPDYYEVLLHGRLDLDPRYSVAVEARYAAKGENDIGRPLEVTDPEDALRRTPSGDSPELILHARIAADVLVGQFAIGSVPLEVRAGAIFDALRVLNRGYEEGATLRDLQLSPYLSIGTR